MYLNVLTLLCGFVKRAFITISVTVFLCIVNVDKNLLYKTSFGAVFHGLAF